MTAKELRFGRNRWLVLDLGECDGRIDIGNFTFDLNKIRSDGGWDADLRSLAVQRGLVDGKPWWVPAAAYTSSLHPLGSEPFKLKELRPTPSWLADHDRGDWIVLKVGDLFFAALPHHTVLQLWSVVHAGLADHHLNRGGYVPYEGWWDDNHGWRFSTSHSCLDWFSGGGAIDTMWIGDRVGPDPDEVTVSRMFWPGDDLKYLFDFGDTGTWDGFVLTQAFDFSHLPTDTPHLLI